MVCGVAELTMLRLASRAMAELAVQRCLSAQLILDTSAMAARLVPRLEVVIWVVDLVWCPFLPLGQSICALALALVLGHFRGVSLTESDRRC